MSWVTIIWSMSAAVSLTLGAIHAVVWLQDRKASANLWFSLLAVSVAVFALLALSMMHALTTTQFGELHRWGHVPLFVSIVALVLFIQDYFRTRRWWLLWTVIGLRVLVIVINFTTGVSFNFGEVTGLTLFHFLGESVSVPVVVATPWARLGESSALLVLVFVLDASIQLWRRGNANERRRAVVVGGSVSLFVSLAILNGLLIHTGFVQLPYFVSLFFVLIVVAMGYELSCDIIHAGWMAEELRENAESMSLAAKAAHFAHWRWDIGKDVIWVSAHRQQLYGIEDQNTIGFQRFLEVIHPDDRDAVRQGVTHCLEGDGDYRAEYRVVLPDGAVRWIGARGEVEFDGHRQPLRMRGVSADITERKHIENEVAEQLRFEILLADLSARFVNVPAEQLDDQIEEAQRHVCECLHVDLASLFQWSVEDPSFTRTHFWRLLKGPPLPMKIDAGDLLPWARQQLQAGQTVVFSSLDELPTEAARDKEHFRYLGIKSGVGIPLSAGGARPMGGLTFNAIREERVWPEAIVKRLRLVAEVFANALARKRSEQALRESQERLSLATDAAGVGLWIMTLSTEQVWVTPNIRELFQFSPEEALTNERFLDVIHPEDRKHVRSGMTDSCVTGVPLNIEYRLALPDGSVRWINSRGRPQRSGSGEPDRLMGVSVDITERKTAESDAARHLSELAHLTRVTTLSELSGSLAHELNQPLAIILSNAQAAQRLLAQSPPDVAEVKEILTDIVSEDRRAGEVIQRLRALLKRGETDLQPLSVNDAIQEVLHLTNADLIGRGVTVTREMAADLPLVKGDRVQFQQVVLNLILNGAEAMVANQRGARRLQITTGHHDDYVRISVRDQGHGLPADVDKLFEPFFTTKPQGLGMGLAICRSIISAHHGTLEATMQPEGGAMFCIEIPQLKTTAT